MFDFAGPDFASPYVIRAAVTSLLTQPPAHGLTHAELRAPAELELPVLAALARFCHLAPRTFRLTSRALLPPRN